MMKVRKVRRRTKKAAKEMMKKTKSKRRMRDPQLQGGEGGRNMLPLL